MTHVKRMVMQGFKSFARKTEIPFEDSMKVIVGPNGSGKSNITDALCFVLGRLSIKSIRAAKAANLIFSGNKTFKGSQEASVELVFDNSDKTFALDDAEVTIKRTVRKNGQSIYKINGATKTRQDLLELLSQGGIDPNGFNIVLQGEIQSLVKSTPEERRKIIEEVAGISIYEARKHKSLRELEKTSEKLKEVGAVLRERNSYLKNLDRERQEAISYKNLDEVIRRCKATLISKSLKDKEKEIWALEKIVGNHEKEIEKIKKVVSEKQGGIDLLQDKILVVNKHIQSSTGDEQETLHRELSDLKADLAGLMVRQENFEVRVDGEKEKVIEYKKKIEVFQVEISQIRHSSPEIKKQQEEHKILSEKFDILEQQRRKFYILKSELSTLEHEKLSREKFLIESKKEISLIEQTITTLFNEIKYAKSTEQAMKKKTVFETELEQVLEKIKNLEKEILESERETAVFGKEIEREKSLQGEVTQIDFCPICKQEVGEDHKHDISQKAREKIVSAQKIIDKNHLLRVEHTRTIEELQTRSMRLRQNISEIGIDLVKIKMGEDKREAISRVRLSITEAEQDIISLNKRLHKVRSDFDSLKDIEEKYDQTRLLLQDLTFHDLDVDTEISVKRREVNRLTAELKSSVREIEDSTIELKKLSVVILEKEKFAKKKEVEEQLLYDKFQKYFQEKNELADKQKVLETDMMGLQNTSRNFEEKINENKIYRAQYNAQIDSLKTELATFGSVELWSGTVEQIKERLQKSQFRISKLGNVNLRALEAFEKVSEQCKGIEEKVGVIEREKENIEKIILEIDKKKKKSFMRTLEAVNELFTRNFSQLSRKSSVFLELENKKEPFEGGLNILVKVSRGRYFDITSLSGGEKTMVALSLIFAIQEYKPYCFYIFDEIDAALDKHNSELLAALIQKYMKTGQYIIITHNDTLISEGKNLYGVSMQENISKIISLKI
ncbi:chromosome segregation protein SMC [archaeon]|nr:chromosome segregation protein SMC [archaeon]